MLKIHYTQDLGVINHAYLGEYMEYIEALQRHCGSKNCSPCLSIPQTFSRHPSWPVDTSKDENAKVGIQMHDVYLFPLLTKNPSPVKIGHIQNNFLNWVGNQQLKGWIDILNISQCKSCGPWYHPYYVSSCVGGALSLGMKTIQFPF